ncbi:MAG: MFS transporter [Alphaproteobacteria bacterium]
MVDIAGENIGVANPAERRTSEVAALQYESDLSPRKLRVAFIILLGQTFATSLLPFIALPLLLVPMTKEFGWTPTQFSYATTSLMWVGAFSSLFCGWVVDYIGCRPIIILGTVLVGLDTMMISHTSGLLTFCLGFAGLGLFGSTGMVYSKVVAGLFSQHRGKALAIMGAESAIAFAIVPQIVNFLLNGYGWRQTFFVLGVVIVAVVPLLYFFLDEVGTKGGSRDLFKFMKAKPAVKSAADEPPPTQLEGMSLKQVFGDYTFWLILLATLIASAPRGGLFTYLSPILSARGFNGQQATANFLTEITLFGVIGSLISGFALDKFQSPKLAVPFKLLAMLALIALGIVSTKFGGQALLVIAAVLWGISQGTLIPTGTYFNTRLFGLKAFGGMMGLNTFFSALFLGAIAPIVGMSQEKTGSYDPAIWVMTGFLFLGAVIYLILRPYRYSAMVGATKKSA